MKIPPAVKGARYCPWLKQGCIGDACAMWTGIWGKQPDGEPTLDEECALVWNVILQRETLVETARVTAGHDKVANETNTIGKVIAYGLQQQALGAINDPQNV